MYKLYFFISLSFLTVSSIASVTSTDNAVSLDSDDAVLMFSRDNGAIISFAEKGSKESVFKSSGPGLWAAHLDKLQINASEFNQDNAEKRFSFEQKGENAVDLIYDCNELKVVVNVREVPHGFEFSAKTTSSGQVLKGLDLPAKLTFDPQVVERFISPADPDESVGIAFNKKFFSEQSLDNPTGWEFRSAGSKAFIALYGQGIPCLSGESAPVELKVTGDGSKWLPAEVVKKVNASKMPVIRPQPAGLRDITLVDTVNGAYFSGSKLGGNGGFLWRIGDGVHGEEPEKIALPVVLGTIAKIMDGVADGQRNIALLDMDNGLAEGLWTSIKVERWRGEMRRLASGHGGEFESIRSIPQLEKALRSKRHLCIVNPYGEGFPARDEAALLVSVAELKKYVHAGGSWFETGGYSFYQLMFPKKYIGHEAVYPPAYADLFHLKSTLGDFALYRAQPRHDGDPWAATDIFVPGRLFCGGDSSGGYMGRSFTTWVQPKQSWTTPKVLLTAGVSLEKTIADYCTKNSITKPLDKKIKTETLAKFKQAPLIYLAGPCKEKQAALDSLPVPSLIHFADYLHGGFDKQYPDHLPPDSRFGTQEEFKSFVTELHARGHLFSPYTNPTWWCDDPKGPTFEKEGPAPLLVKADKENRFENYSGKTGWTTTLWHPAVQAANRKVRKQFIEDLPVDMLFQDQCGARGFLYDFNSAAPTPYAYSEGMISMNDEDSRLVPLGTEHGWDRVADFQTMLCGMTWGIVPTKGGPPWRKCFKKRLPPQTWEIYPLAQAISHDKCVFGHHDLGQFVTDNRSLSWSLALGYHLSWRGNADFAKYEPNRMWYAWLCRLQKSVASRYTGMAMKEFRHDRSSMLERDIDHTDYNDDGTISATYGSLKIAANLGPVERVVEGWKLAPYGFYAEAPGMTAGIMTVKGEGAETAFVAEHNSGSSDFWLFAAPGEQLSVPIPYKGKVKVALVGQPAQGFDVVNGFVSLTLPEFEKPVTRIEPSEDIQRSAPCNRAGDRPYIGVLNLGGSVHPVWARVSADQWVQAIENSSLCTLHGLKVKSIGSYADLVKAFQEEPGRWLAIVNPYGECILSEKPGAWKQTLDAVRNYVNHGGSWWETGGFSFHSEIYNDGNGWNNASVGSAGMEYLGLGIGEGDIECVPGRLCVTQTGEHWFGKPFAERINKQYAQVNRSLPRINTVPFTPLVQDGNNVYVGGYRFEGWGHLWRIGGMKPVPSLATSVMISTTLHQYTNPPEPIRISGTPRLWHATVECR